MRRLVSTLTLLALLLSVFAGAAFAQDSAAVEVEDQPLVDNTVTIARVVSPDSPGFIVIHASKEDGTFGEVIGNTGVQQGENTDVVVAVPEDVAVGDTLWAMLHLDDNTVGTYEFGTVEGADAPVVVDGEIVMTAFEVTEGDMAMAEEEEEEPETLPETGSSTSNLPLLIAAAGLLLVGAALALRPRLR